MAHLRHYHPYIANKHQLQNWHFFSSSAQPMPVETTCLDLERKITFNPDANQMPLVIVVHEATLEFQQVFSQVLQQSEVIFLKLVPL
jgi:hypothetical protein